MHAPTPPPFDLARDEHVALFDELPLWSALAGQLLLEHVPLDARRVLDVGCGAGFPLFELAERLGEGARVVGVDPWAAALRRAGAKRSAWPVANAHIIAMVSGPRHSPTMIRSGFMRSASETRSSRVTAGSPSGEAARAS